MKIKINRGQLLKGLQTVQGVAQERTTLPIISNTLIEAGGDSLRFTATDLDVTIACSVEASVQNQGRTTLPIKKLVAIIKELTGEIVEMEVDDKDVASVICGRSRYHLNGLTAGDFPTPPQRDKVKVFSLEQGILKQALGRTRFAQSTEATRFVLNGILFVLSKDSATFVSADGRRLALASEECSVNKGGDGEFILPTKAVNELDRLIDAGEGVVKCSYTEQYAQFIVVDDGKSTVEIISKLVEGSFPNYKQIIPSKFNESVPIVRLDFLGSLRRADVMTTDKAASVKLAFSKNLLTITSNTASVGDATEELDLKYKGKDTAIAFNPKYLIDALSALNDEVVFFEFIDELSPAAVKLNGPFIYILSPMRLA